MSDAVSMREFGSWLAGLRESTGSGSQADAARKIGVARGQVARWETGKSYPHSSKMQSIADAYHIDVSEIHKRMGNSETQTEVSDWASAVARRLERRTAGMTAKQRAAVERAFDSILSVATER